MKNYLFLFVLLTSISSQLFSQNLEGKNITLNALTSVTGKEFVLETSCFKNEIKIKLKIADSVSFDKLKTDSTYIILSKSLLSAMEFNTKNDTLMNLYKRFDSLIKANTVYSMDSISINYNQFIPYDKLLTKLFNSTPTELENKENNKNRMVLDGTSMEFKFSQNDSIKYTVFAHSPTKLSHPLLYDYLNSTLEIYRKLKNNNIFDKQKTSGY